MGYGAKDDEWYWEEDLKATAPHEVKQFNKTWLEDRRMEGRKKRRRERRKAKRGERKGLQRRGRDHNGCKCRIGTSQRNDRTAEMELERKTREHVKMTPVMMISRRLLGYKKRLFTKEMYSLCELEGVEYC